MHSRSMKGQRNGLSETEKEGNYTDCKPKLCSFRLLNVDSHWFTWTLNGGRGWGQNLFIWLLDFRWIKWVYYIITGLPLSSWCTVCLQNSSSLGFRTEGYVFVSQRWGICKLTHKLMQHVALFSHSNKVLGAFLLWHVCVEFVCSLLGCMGFSSRYSSILDFQPGRLQQRWSEIPEDPFYTNIHRSDSSTTLLSRKQDFSWFRSHQASRYVKWHK